MVAYNVVWLLNVMCGGCRDAYGCLISWFNNIFYWVSMELRMQGQPVHTCYGIVYIPMGLFPSEMVTCPSAQPKTCGWIKWQSLELKSSTPLPAGYWVRVWLLHPKMHNKGSTYYIFRSICSTKPSSLKSSTSGLVNSELCFLKAY